LWIFAIAFGVVEASVVVYLRALFGQTGDSLFPLVILPLEGEWLVTRVEAIREVATLLLMLTPALLFSRRAILRFLAYALVFGLWDLSYYAFLKLWLDWPAGPLTYDVLFLLPTLWVAPVLCPVLVSLGLVSFTMVYLGYARVRILRAPEAGHWLVALTGGALVLAAFMKDADYWLQGGIPPRFSWLLFGIGYGLAALAGTHFLVRFARQARSRFR
jgi:hypothetical protein